MCFCLLDNLWLTTAREETGKGLSLPLDIITFDLTSLKSTGKQLQLAHPQASTWQSISLRGERRGGGRVFCYTKLHHHCTQLPVTYILHYVDDRQGKLEQHQAAAAAEITYSYSNTPAGVALNLHTTSSSIVWYPDSSIHSNICIASSAPAKQVYLVATHVPSAQTTAAVCLQLII